MKKININIQPEIVSIIKSRQEGLYQITGLPDSGVSLSAIALLDKLLTEHTFGLYIASYDNILSLEVAKEAASAYKQNIVVAIIDYNDAESLHKIIDKYCGLIDYVLIDDFARLVINRKRNYINYLAETLQRKSRELKAPVILLSQLRFQVKPGITNSTDTADLKPLYVNYLEPFIAANFEVVKNQLKISLQLASNKLRKHSNPFNCFNTLLNALEADLGI